MRFARPFVAALALSALSAVAHAAATITIVNGNAAGVGFNDPTPASPVGGNTGATLGEQRLAVFQRAAQIWGATLDSTVPIEVLATFEPLTCTSTTGVLGSAGTTSVFRDFANAPRTGVWYPAALANKLAGTDLLPSGAEIRARFNSSIGQTGCLDGSAFYLGLDGSAPPSQINLLAVVLHELAHGLGFANQTNGSTGAQLGTPPFPSIWDTLLLDLSTGKRWSEMTPEERVASAVRPRNLAWTGTNVQRAALGDPAEAPSGRPAADGRISRVRADGVLDRGQPQLILRGGAQFNVDVPVGSASFGPGVPLSTLSLPVLYPQDSTGSTLGCNAFAGTAPLAGRIVLIDRGVCGFTAKVRNAQDAGAAAVVIADNVAGGPPPDLGGSDPLVTIPAVRITLEDGNALKAALNAGAVTASLGRNLIRMPGAEARGRLLMFTPSVFSSGSSVSHFDTSAAPNLLMEPNISASLRDAVRAPGDLTFELLRDIGW